MSKGFCYVAHDRTGEFPIREFLKCAESFGFSALNPITGEVSTWNEEGDEVDVMLQDLGWLLSREKQLTFQLWLSADVDVSCSFRSLHERLYVEVFSLDGLSNEEEDKIVLCAVEWFKVLAKQGTCLFGAVDRKGVTSDFDWDAFVLGGGSSPVWLPDVLGLRKGTITFNGRLEECRVEHVGVCDLYYACNPALGTSRIG